MFYGMAGLWRGIFRGSLSRSFHPSQENEATRKMSRQRNGRKKLSPDGICQALFLILRERRANSAVLVCSSLMLPLLIRGRRKYRPGPVLSKALFQNWHRLFFALPIQLVPPSLGWDVNSFRMTSSSAFSDKWCNANYERAEAFRPKWWWRWWTWRSRKFLSRNHSAFQDFTGKLFLRSNFSSFSFVLFSS